MRFKKLLAGIFLFILTALILVFLFKNSMLSWAFDKVKTKVKTNYHLNLSAAEVKFSGFKEVAFSNIIVVPDSADTLLTINNARLNLALFGLLKGKIAFAEIQLDTFRVNAFNKKEHNNLSFLKHKSKTTTESESKSVMTYQDMAETLADKIFSILNTKFELNYFTLNYEDSLRSEQLLIPMIKYDKELLNGELISLKNKDADTLNFSAEVVKHNRLFNFNVSNIDSEDNYLPFLNIDKQLRCNFKSLSGTIELNDEGDFYSIKTNFTGTNIIVNHWRLANDNVVLPYLHFDGDFKITDNTIVVDSNSALKLNHALLNLYFKRERKPISTITLKVKMAETPADSFFKSLPEGMFSTLKGIKTSGIMSYNLVFNLDENNPDALIFESELKKKNFKIIQYGAENYSRINEPFLFDALDGDRLVRQIMVGPESYVFTPYDQISPYIKNAVMTSEDGSFMYHRGFNEDAFRQSIVTNYKEKRFARGGSTITMQLVKNCFLSRNKTVSRKAEEALIVWLIENCGLVSKERLLEVYLNVIEWGPDVYGIGEASGYYFGKQPKDLTLAESIFLASIVPHPKYFKYSFDSSGNLKPFLASYYKLIASKMLSREWIVPEDTVGLLPNVLLTGPAKNMVLITADTLPVPSDSLFMEDLQIVN